MKSSFFKPVLVITALILIGSVFYFSANTRREVDFSSEVKPIINSKCIACHGGVKAKSGFSLLFREEALSKAESGKYPIVPGNPDESELIRRIKMSDPDERMPYKHEPLSDEQISIFYRWIQEGAKWGEHWAYVPVKEQKAPEVDYDGAVNDVDRYIYQKLSELELEPSPEADKSTLLRRVSLDLIGRYPSNEIIQKYLAGEASLSYEELVDSLLASPSFGERWASMWLDVARYADTKGYEKDLGRDIWRYRDWVIDAFNEDKGYDKFVEEQLAGDLFPNPSDAQYIATAFNRNTMTNDEGGTDNEEFRMAAVIDRVNTVWEGMLGTTFSCVQCHSHPYDPFRHEEYYSFLAYFNNTRDEDQSPEYPFLRIYDKDKVAQVNKLTAWVKQHSNDQQAESVKLFVRTLQPLIYSSTSDSIKRGFTGNNNGPLSLYVNASFRLKNVNLKSKDELIFKIYPSNLPGRLTMHLDSLNTRAVGEIYIDKSKKTRLLSLPFISDQKTHDIYFKFNNKVSNPESLDHTLTFEWFAFIRDLPKTNISEYRENKKLFFELINNDVQNIPVMVENPNDLFRSTHVFERGNRLTLGQEVQPNVPELLSFALPANAEPNRKGAASWLTNKNNPLLSRTIVNRLWEQLFGTGIVETLEDMGTQGSLPTHKELLDHYSWKLMNDYGWSIKRLLKEFVMSATYRQDSKFNDQQKEKDPNNKYYARGPRLRLQPEQLRDQHLCISGVVNDKMYGPAVMPWQPEGIWSSPYSSELWKNSEGADQYRRSIYTYWKRTASYPSALTFDASSRVVCTPRRIRTNTPLQALVLLNDSAYLDMAHHFAKRMIKEGGENLNDQIARGYEIMLFKKIPADKLRVFIALYNSSAAMFQKKPSEAALFIGSSGAQSENTHMAALKVVANTMLNLDEVITKN